MSNEIEIPKYKQVLSEASFSSGITFWLSGNALALRLPVPVIAQSSDSELVSWYEKQQQISYEDMPKSLTYAKYVANVLESAKEMKPYEFIGGLGTTWRTLEQMELDLPGISERMQQESGKTVFLGNGLSAVPHLVAENYKAGLTSKPPVVVDIFDYPKALHDCQRILELLDQRSLPIIPPLTTWIHNLGQLVTDENEQILKSVNYYIGTETIPADLRGADLVVNCYGPGLKSLHEQLDMLVEGGELYTTYHPKKIPSGFTMRKTPVSENGTASIIKRLT